MGDATQTISVIVPIYNVEQYLCRCLDSIISQTYTNIEIILVNDGSTDKCTEICNSYLDPRIRVIHTENRGLSAARNTGINLAKGEYFYFVDSDDWIDQDILKQAIEAIGDADILCFCHERRSYTGSEALIALIKGGISTFAWDKLYRKECFQEIRFPEGRIIEDIATTYKLIAKAERVNCAIIQGYHHTYREDSLCQKHDVKNLFDFCTATKEQYEYCMDYFSSQSELTSKQFEEIHIGLLRFHAYAIARAWAWRIANPLTNSAEWDGLVHESRTLFPYRVRRRFPMRIRGGLFLSRHNNLFSFWLAHKIHVLTRKVPNPDNRR